jgi:hypothetical protein
MLFNSYEFLLVFLPTAVMICWFADDHPSVRTWVLIALRAGLGNLHRTISGVSA